MDEDLKMQGNFDDMIPDTKYPEEGLLSYPTDPLALDIPDEDLVAILDDREDDYDTFYETKYDLFERRKKNEVHYFGRQILEAEKEKLYKEGESRYNDNVLYEIMGTVKPLGMSRVPDLMATPANDSETAQLVAQELSLCLDTEIKEEENRFVLGLAYKHLPVYFTAVLKTWWNPEKDDYEFGVIHPDLIKFDYTQSTKDADKMLWISQKVPLTVMDIGFRFPQAKEKFYNQLKSDGLMVGENPSWALLATPLKISECWFHEYKRTEGNKIQRIDGVFWKYKKVLLHKMKNPNFDYEGEERYFAYDEPGNESSKRGLNQQELAYILLNGSLPDNVIKQKVYHNYFKNPRKPFYFMGYDQWGKQPLDETSWLEQNIQNQKNLNTIGKKIEETLKSRGHHILNKEAVTPAELEEIDFDERNLDLSVQVPQAGGIDNVYKYIPPETVTPQEFQELENVRSRMYAIAHSTAVRGELASKEAAATNNQIAREGDFTSADDVVEDTINPAAQWMGEWAMQFIKLRYTRDHMRWVMGIAGDMVWQRLNRNMVMEGMLVKIKASGSDKLKAQNNAMEMAKMQMTDPYTFYKDMGLSDPEGRTEKLILAKTDPVAYLQKVVKGLNTSEALAQALARAEMPLQQNSNMLPQVPLEQGGLPPSPAMATQPQAVAPAQPQQPTPVNTAQVPVQPPTQPPQQGIL